jgi:hypothetical protein
VKLEEQTALIRPLVFATERAGKPKAGIGFAALRTIFVDHAPLLAES